MKTLLLVLSLAFIPFQAFADQPIPDGFEPKIIKKGDTLWSLCKGDSVSQAVFMSVNHLDNRHLPTGKKVLVPTDIEQANRYVPIPKKLSDSRDNREIRVFLDTQYFGAYENGALVFWGPVSSGRIGKTTPAGEYAIAYKQRYKCSKKYDNAPMPYSLNLSNTGYFLHQQALPGYPASHGCVRLLMKDAERLFFWSRVGDPVTVVERSPSVMMSKN
ncbi:MAG: L,D-transpeptidase family protein [Candidatus Moraniibacteriota bacterium]